MAHRSYGRYTVDTSRERKILFPAAGLTKGDLIDYYERVAAVMLPHVRGRCVSMERYPDGIEGEGFYQKDISDYFPDWLDTKTVEKEGGTVEHAVIEKTATLVYLADQACITPHTWLSRTDKLYDPDRLVIDLDPTGGEFDQVRRAARWVRDLFDEIGLEARPMLTGSTGVHVVAPLDRSAAFDVVRDFANRAMDLLAARHPDVLTTEPRKNKRGGRLYLDTARNAYAQTAVPPYAVRVRPGAPVAVPIDWDELGRCESAAYDIRSAQRRLAQKGDPWSDLPRRGRSLASAFERLDKLHA